VFGLSIVTLGIFGMIWMVVQANWVKKVTRNSRPFWWCLAYLVSLPMLYLLAITVGATGVLAHRLDIVHDFTGIVIPLYRIGMLVLYIVAAYTLKGALEAEPIDIPLGGIMTFLFAPIYFQYHLFDYSVEGKVGEQLSGMVEPVVASAPVAVVNVPEVPPQA
jgi:hypothetical protein